MERTIIDGVLVLLISVAAYTDLRRGKVYNALTFPAIGLGLALNGIIYGAEGLLESLRAGAMAFAFLIALVALSRVGAGDLKLLVAVGALEGVKFLMLAFVGSALIVSAVSLAILGYRRLALAALPAYAECGPGQRKGLPYALAVAPACLVALHWR